MSQLSAYSGRTVDLLALRQAPPGATQDQLQQTQVLVSPGDTGYLIAGLGKLAQEVLMVLLTPKGSQQYWPQFGTQFMNDARNGLWRTPGDVMQSFYSARLDVSQQMQTSAFVNDPLDEQYKGMSLLNVTIGGDVVTLQIALTSQAGTTAVFLAPIAVPVS
jgi:hypothetical protein